MNLANYLLRAGRSHGEWPALYLGDALWADYATFARRAAGLAATLTGRFGLAAGDRVALFMRNCPQYLELQYACWWAGLAVVPVNNRLHERELAFILENSGARILFVSHDLAEKGMAAAGHAGCVERVLMGDDGEQRAMAAADAIGMVPVMPRDLAWLFYTSGTTGRPKGAMLSHRNLMVMTLTFFIDIDEVSPRGTVVHAAPISHGAGLWALPFVARGARQAIPESGGFEPEELYRLIGRHPEVAFFAAPTMVKRFVEYPSDADTSNLKGILYGGGPMYVADAKRALQRFGPKLVQAYGQGESPMTITVLSRADHVDTAHPRHEERLASVGHAQSCVEVRVVDSEDRDLPTGETGEVLVRGDVVMEGYWRNEEATARALADGWLHTGDVGAFDADGYLTLKDRSKDMIISGGSNIYPREIEEVLLTHPDVLECAVVGRPHPE
ncbi:MAG: long-chain fatty acid--CoA ligase [Alphaproteobacteria bacterium]|nr:long-chain fatty acid--CoA ligase [Alphaproteobacteria bacterium]